MPQRRDTMKKKLEIIIPILLLIYLAAIVEVNPRYLKEIPVEKNKVVDKVKQNNNISITELRKKYNNQDIVAYVKIPGVLGEPIVQTTDNEYYLHHDITKQDNIIGANFLDYRNNLDTDKKLLIYSHSDPEQTLPFVVLKYYNDEKFFNNHKYIYLIDSNKARKYEVFASYIETEDFDYVNLKSFGSLTYGGHLNKLKAKSYVKSDVEVGEDSKVLILQTCSFVDIDANTKYQLVMGKEV